MNLHSHSIGVLFLFILLEFTSAIINPSHITGDILINCGSKGTSASNNGREWIGDIQPKSSSLLQLKGSSTTSTVIPDLISSDPVPHKTARISRSQFSYRFQVSPGQKILRLHFNPTSYKGFQGFNDLFTVEAGPFTLLGIFSASLAADALGVDSFIKEFCLNVQENQQLDIIFSPEISHLLDTYAFINGVEIFSVPASLSYFEGGDVGLQLVGEKSLVYFDYKTALEIIHRIEIKQNSFLPAGDSDDLFPKWAARNAKKRNNNTWNIPVDVGFKYLIRVHISELGVKIAESGGNMFEVLINEMIAQTNIDAAKGREETNIPLYRDCMVMVRGNKKEGKRDILISLNSSDDRTLVSGFEIFKLSNSDNSLASPNPSPLARDSPSDTVQTLLFVLIERNSISTVAVVIISLVCIVVHKLQEIQEANITEEENTPTPSQRDGRICRHFSLDEIRLATNNFSDALEIGMGGFGKVYKGHIDKNQTVVAVKRLKSSSDQGVHEFLTEIETLSELRHVNLVSLFGYCNEQEEMILVYEYMSRGTLGDHIYKLARENNTYSFLTWKQRLDICIGAGRGLDYLHTGNNVIHRDVKTTNILLDENFIAKVSDFGLAKPENISNLQGHVSTNVKGTFGYLDPNYSRTHKLTRKSDTYGFGVVLLEVLCGRAAVDSKVVKEEQILSIWAQDKIKKGEVDQIVATSLRDEISPNSLKIFVGVVEKCLSDEPKKRPTMSQVVSQLELALEQQGTKQPLKITTIVKTGQPTIFSTTVQNFTPNSKEQINSNMVIAQLPNNNKDGPSFPTEQPTIFSTNVQNFTPDPKEQINNNVVIAQLPNNNKDGPSVQTAQPTIFSTAVQNFTPPPREQTSSSVVIAQLPPKENELPSVSALAAFDLGTSTPAISKSCPTSDSCRRFLLEEIKSATSNFDDNSIICKGRFSDVYKGFIEDRATTLAIKRVKKLWDSDFHKFLHKIDMASKLRHLHVVSPIGYCDEGGEMILVYDYMVHGSLYDHLYKKNPPLKWKQRLQICIGAARGLHYLNNTVNEYHKIHRIVNSTNILLDEKWVAKVSVAPTYIWHGSIIEEKDNMYSFGLVLLQVLFIKPRKPLDIHQYAESCRRGAFKKYIDPNLNRQIAPQCLSKFVETALACIKKESEPPATSDVVRSLELAMQLQEAAEQRDNII
ncbi:hypothetical protein ABFX02_08G032500 [Erythranthe guttata]